MAQGWTIVAESEIASDALKSLEARTLRDGRSHQVLHQRQGLLLSDLLLDALGLHGLGLGHLGCSVWEATGLSLNGKLKSIFASLNAGSIATAKSHATQQGHNILLTPNTHLKGHRLYDHDGGSRSTFNRARLPDNLLLCCLATHSSVSRRHAPYDINLNIYSKLIIIITLFILAFFDKWGDSCFFFYGRLAFFFFFFYVLTSECGGAAIALRTSTANPTLDAKCI